MKKLITILLLTISGIASAQTYQLNYPDIRIGSSNTGKISFKGSNLRMPYIPLGSDTDSVMTILDGVIKKVPRVQFSSKNTVGTISEMQAYSGDSNYIKVLDKERGGDFVLSNDSNTDDNGVIFAATGKGAGFHWVRQYTGAYINVRWFPNIVADSVTDCSAGINAIPIKYTYRYFPGGKYKLNAPMVISSTLGVGYWSIMGEDVPLKTFTKGTVFIAGFTGDVVTTGNTYSNQGIQFKNFQVWNAVGGYGLRSTWPETRVNNVRMLNCANGIKIAYLNGSNGAFDCTLTDIKIEASKTGSSFNFTGVGLYLDRGTNNVLFNNSFLVGFGNAIVVNRSENVNIIQNNLNASGDYAIKVLDSVGTINLNIENNYIESQNKALYVGNSSGVHVINNQINDATYGGPDNLVDAHLYFTANASSVTVARNNVVSTFQNQSFVHAENNITLQDNSWKRLRTGSTFLGTNFDIPEGSWQRDTLQTITSGSVTVGVNKYNAVKNYLNLKKLAYTNTTTESISIDSDPDGSGLAFRSLGGSLRWLMRTTGTEAGSNSGSALNFVARDDAGNFLINAATILRSGFFGLNNTNPLARLDVNGTARVSTNDGSSTALVRNTDLANYATTTQLNTKQNLVTLTTTPSPTSFNQGTGALNIQPTDLSNYVTINTAQTISGPKSFSQTNTFENTTNFPTQKIQISPISATASSTSSPLSTTLQFNGIQFNYNSFNLVFSAPVLTQNRVVSIQDKPGTMALLSDINSPSISTKTANYTVLLTDYTLVANTTSSAITFTLPTAASAYNASTGTGNVFSFKRNDSGTTNALTIQANGAELIDGTNTKIITSAYGGFTVQSTGTTWIIKM